MGLFSTRNSDGASALAESCNTISSSTWKGLRHRAIKADPDRADIATPRGTASAKAGAAQFDKRGQS